MRKYYDNLLESLGGKFKPKSKDKRHDAKKSTGRVKLKKIIGILRRKQKKKQSLEESTYSYRGFNYDRILIFEPEPEDNLDTWLVEVHIYIDGLKEILVYDCYDEREAKDMAEIAEQLDRDYDPSEYSDYEEYNKHSEECATDYLQALYNKGFYSAD